MIFVKTNEVQLLHFQHYLCSMFSKTFGHALRATTYIATHGTQVNKVALSVLAQGLNIPQPVLGKVVQELVRHGIMDSTKGPNGGFFINNSTLQTPLTSILKITDGSLLFTQCALGLKPCNPNHPCLLHHHFAVCRDGMIEVLEQKTIQDLVLQAEQEFVFLV